MAAVVRGRGRDSCWDRRCGGHPLARSGGRSSRRPGWAQGLVDGLAEGGALTISATVATAPLLAHHFDAVSLAALPANLLALPAVAPAMWLGMLKAALGQLEVAAGRRRGGAGAGTGSPRSR